MDFKSAFWQVDIEEESRYLSVSRKWQALSIQKVNNGIKPSQGELNTALKPVFAHIYNAHLIHDDLNVATKTDDEHVKAIKEVMKAISGSGLTLNPNKCSFGQKHIILGMIYGADGII